MGAQENKLPKLQILQNEILHMTILPVFSQSVKFDIHFLGLQSKLVFGGYYR